MDVGGYLRVLALAEARTSARQWPAAAALWQQVVTVNPVNGSHRDRLAQAYFEAGDYSAALAAYQKAGDLGIWDRGQERETIFAGEVQYRVARCHVRLGDADRAIGELERAFRAGLRDLDRVRADPCWLPVRDHDRFRALFDVDVSGLSRDEGWRRDLRLFGREVKRRAYDPFRHCSEDDFDAQLARLDQQVPELTEAQILAGLLKLLRPLGDGHAGVTGTGDYPALRQILPLEFYLFAEGLFVTSVDPRYRQLLGAKVLSFDGRPADEISAAIDPIISRDNDYQAMAAVPRWLRCPPMLHALDLIAAPDAVTLSVRLPDGATAEVALETDASVPWTIRTPLPGWLWLPETLATQVPRYLRNRDLDYWFEHLTAERTVYVQINSVADHPAETLPAFTDRLFAYLSDHDADTLVIDLRWNGGGNTFLTQSLLHNLIACRRVNRPGSLFVIIGRHTFSAAQNTATAIERHTHAIFVGEPTGSSPNFVGEVAAFELPYSKFMVNVSDLYWQTSWPMDLRPWIAPEIYTPPTFEDYQAGRDPAMEAIAAYREHPPGR